MSEPVEQSFIFLAGSKFEVTAISEQEAWNKFGAYQSEEPCPCGVDDCDCVSEMEADTWMENDNAGL